MITSRRGFLAWILGDYSAETFAPLWSIVAAWNCYFYGKFYGKDSLTLLTALARARADVVTMLEPKPAQHGLRQPPEATPLLADQLLIPRHAVNLGIIRR
ncbi:hypothetical protein C8255_00950 [filamentous cyanobacterium CCP3]|nr:hypothetical protein C8255_00950 [filamentous cyanobacterium CCP3]